MKNAKINLKQVVDREFICLLLALYLTIYTTYMALAYNEVRWVNLFMLALCITYIITEAKGEWRIMDMKKILTNEVKETVEHLQGKLDLLNKKVEAVRKLDLEPLDPKQLHKVLDAIGKATYLVNEANKDL